MNISVSQLLKQEREKRNLTIEDVEKATRIRKDNLIAVESSKWDSFPSRTYVYGVISTYGAFLELDKEKLLAYFRREYEKRESVKFREQTAKKFFQPHTKRNIQYVLVLIAIFFGIYFGFQLRNFYAPPYLEVTAPTQTNYRRQEKIIIQGMTQENTVVKINGKQINVRDNLTFQSPFPLVDKTNKAVIEATGPNGKKTTVTKIYTVDKP